LLYFLMVLGVSAGVGYVSQHLPGSAGHRSRLAETRGTSARQPA
jgi:hypothetical protein